MPDAETVLPLEVRKSVDLTKLDELAFKDVERRAEGLVQLILHNDRKGTQFVATYLAVGGAICGVIVAQKGALSLQALAVATVAIVALTAGIIFSLLAQWTVEMYPTGRLPDFWFWSRRHEVAPSDVIDTHLASSMKAIEHNDKVNSRSSLLLKRAYICGLIAFGIVGLAMTTFTSSIIVCRLAWEQTATLFWLAPLCRL